MLIIYWKHKKMAVKKAKLDSDNVAIHARKNNPYLNRCYRNFCILIGLLTCDNWSMLARTIHASIVVIETSAFWLAY